MRVTRGFLIAATALSGIGGLSSQAVAQTTADASASSADADAIVVTARRRAEDVSKVPIAITAFTGETLVAKGIQNTQDLIKITPGLNIADNGSKVGPYIVLRGQSRSAVGTGSAGVITYFNDVPLPIYGTILQTFDMDNIQVVKGPQGTLFGRNALGGAILTYTKGAKHEFGGYVTADIASHDYKKIEGAINVPIVKDVVALRLAAQVYHDGGATKTYLYSPYTVAPVLDSSNNLIGATATPGKLVPSTHNVDEYASESYRATLLIEPTDWFKNVTVGDYSKIRGITNNMAQQVLGGLYSLPGSSAGAAIGGGAFGTAYGQIIDSLAHCGNSINCDIALFANQLTAQGTTRVSYVTEDPWRSVAKIAGISNTTTIHLGENHQLKNIFAVRTLETFSNTSLTGAPIPVINTVSVDRERVTTEELQLSGSFFNNDLKYTLGGFSYNEKPNGVGGYQGLEVNAFFGLSHSLATTYLHNSSKAIYGQVDYSLDKLIPGLTLTGGLRQTWDTQGVCTTASVLSPFGPQFVLSDVEATKTLLPTEAQCGAVAAQQLPDAHFKKLTYTLNANWQITPDAMVYVAHRRGYRQGGYNTPLLDSWLSSLQTYAPETLTDWEIGAKVRWSAGETRGTFEVALYSGKDTSFQVPVTTSNLSNGVCVVEALGTAGHTASNCTVSASQVSAGYQQAAGTPGSLVFVNGQVTYDNAASLLIRGVEAAATITPVDAVTIGGSLAYIDVTPGAIALNPRFKTFLSAAKLGTPSLVPQGQPEWTATANLTLRYPAKVFGGQLTAVADYHYNSRYRQNDFFIPSSQNIDLRVGVDDIGGTGLSATAYVRNLADRVNYVGGASTSKSIGIPSFNRGSSRTVGMALTYKFGAQ